VAGFCEHGNEPSGSMKKTCYSLTTWLTISFSKNILHHGVSNTDMRVFFLASSWPSSNCSSCRFKIPCYLRPPVSAHSVSWYFSL